MSNSTIVFLTNFHERVCELSKSIVFNKEKILHFHIMALYGSVLEYASSMLIMTKYGPKLAIPVVFRALLDASLDMLNLCNDPKYGHRLEVDYLRGRKDFLGRVIRGDKKRLKEFGEMPEIKEKHKEIKAREKAVKSMGYSEIDMAEKFRLLDMEDEYFFIYRMLNNHVHNSIDALQQRHIEEDEGVFHVVYYKDTPPEDLEPYFGMTIELIMRCSEKLHEVFESPAQRQVQELRVDVDAIRAMYASTRGIAETE